MIKKILILPLFMLAVITMPFAGYAADEAQPPAEDAEAKPVEKDKLVEAQEEAIEKTHGLLLKVIEGLTPAQQQHFFLTYNNYNLVGTAEIVRGDVENAIKACGENNPEMKDDLDQRFAAWDGAIKPVLDEAQGHLDNMVIAQDYADKKEIEAVFNSIEETRERTDERFDKVPVTTPEACEYLLGKMDETQQTLLSLLRATLMNYAQEELPAQEQDDGAAADNEGAAESAEDL